MRLLSGIRRLGLTAFAGLFTSLGFAPAVSRAQEDDEFQPGLVATFASSDHPRETATRVDRTVAFDWQSDPPDPRLSTGPFHAAWSGFFLVPGPGEYRFAVYAAGEVKISLAGNEILAASAAEPQWLDAKPLELAFGWLPIEIEYRSREKTARLALFWSGPQFAWEPVGERQLYHEPQNTPQDRFERGEALAAALRCQACHAAPGRANSLPAPALDRLAGNLSTTWLVEWLKADGDGDDEPAKANSEIITRRMPHFALNDDEANAVAAYLFAKSQPTTRAARPKPASEAPANKDRPPKEKEKEKEKEKPNAAAGERLALTLGCLACHRLNDLGESGLFGGGDLSRIADKRPPEFFTQWLADPTSLNRDRRMPIFETTVDERESLSLFLASLRGEHPGDIQTRNGNDENLAREGRRLVDAHRCGACHTLPTDAYRSIPVRALSENSAWDRACTGTPRLGKQPGYRLSPDDAAAVREYLLATVRVAAPPPAVDARLVLRERNCLACHARDGAPGLGPKLASLIAARQELAPLLPAMTPPPLASVGDKLHDRALADAIRREGKPHRPYLAVRMPKFDLSEAELQSLVRRFTAQDRIPPRPMVEPATVEPAPSPEFDSAGARLVTSDGFGCVSCHQIGAVLPEKAPLNARGPDISLLSQRIRREWFDRWVRNPARIVPRMEMPAVQLPVRGVLHEDLPLQLEAVWHALNTPGFEPPPPDPVRILRRAGVRERGEDAVVATDVLVDRGHEYVKPFLIGLPNRHNFLFDLETNRVAGWWLGDAARQRTKGKSWYWESGGDPSTQLLDAPPGGSELALEIDGQRFEPLVEGQFPTEVDSWSHIAGGLKWNQRLRFKTSEEGSSITVHVAHTIEPIWPGEADQNGSRRTLTIRGIPARAKIVFQASKPHDGAAQIQLAAPAGLSLDDRGAVALAPRGKQDVVELTLEYHSSRRPDTFPTELQTSSPPPAPTPLFVAPGFEAVQLPLSESLMPTAFAWQPDGALAIASLKGQVWLARDTDADGLPDTAKAFSDDLAAPYGLAAGKGYLDVVNKYALLRLHDDDGDGRAERTETLASGWGHTSDYHDWAVGLPRDDSGNYYVALPCQQDDRSAAAAHLRGSLLRLVPRPPTADDPRAFALEEVTAGHRFPMGIARRHDGEMFVTDNQGNFNPFNELNHIVPGRRYGFINKIEQKPGFKPPFAAPAIDIPHPWTRSVNGICFLETPSAVREKLGKDLFGPFEGHLIGCEMNNKLLVRMSLQRVGDEFQGAIYPMSFATPPRGPALLGPLCAEISPAGDLYVGSLLDSGWGGGNNIGAVVRMRPTFDELPAGIREVRAGPCGLVIEFTRPVDRQRAADPANYALSTCTRISTPAYGGDDVDRRIETIASVEVDDDGASVLLPLPNWREGYVYELHLQSLVGPGEQFFPAEAHYTLRHAPQ